MKKIFITIIVLLLMHSPSFAENTLHASAKKSTFTKTNETFTEFEDENIKITREKKYVGDKDTNKYGYIYSISNKSTMPITIKKVSSPDRIKYATVTYYIGYGSPSLLALTAVSGVLCAQALNNAETYLKPLPQDYTINPESTTQVLFLAKKYIDPCVKFEFEIKGHSKIINSKSTYIVRDTEYYKNLLKSEYCPEGYFWLHYYINKREIPLIEAYLKSGTLDEKDSYKDTLLIMVLNNETNQNAFGDYEIRPYVTEENIKILELLLESGANAKDRDSLMYTTVLTRNAKIVQLLLSYGANPNFKTLGQYPAYQAIIYNQPEILKLLLDAGADPNAVVRDKTLLCWSTIKKHPEMVKLLIDKKANINEFSGKMSPLAYATKKKQTEIVKNLINAGATIDENSIKYAEKSKDENIKNLILLKSKWDFCCVD